MANVRPARRPFRRRWVAAAQERRQRLPCHGRVVKRSPLAMRLRRLAAALVGLFAVLLAAFVVLWQASPFPLDRLDRRPAATLLLDREGRVLRGSIAADDSWCFPAAFDDFSPWLIQATVAVEDGRFWTHPGVDGWAALRAARQNVARGRAFSGASTITMQVVRLMDDRPRNMWNKAVEAFRALQLERLRDKREILAAYLNRAPYGSNLVGAEAAALRYFGKRAADLTLAEAALLAGLPQSPSRYRPDRHPDRALARQRFVLSEMRRRGFITDDELAQAAAQPLHPAFRPLPLRAPHFCDLAQRKGVGPPCSSSRTTLDLTIQTMAERALRDQVALLRDRGVTNGAVVVIENATGAVRALVGSVDYTDSDAGRVNHACAPRSPGSALKPFIYALAFDAGFATPETVLADIPMGFPGYRPENYDREFRGPVPAGSALAASLNIPALDLTRRLGVGRLRQTLIDSGLTTIRRPAEAYGLTLTLGTAEVTLLDLTNAYAALARLGEWRPYEIADCRLPIADCRTGRIAGESPPAAAGGNAFPSRTVSARSLPPAAPSRRVFSPGAAYLVAQALGDRGRLERALGVAQCRASPTIAWKTGTSTGRRDAWTVGYNPEYTVGVWLGNSDGRGSPALVGAEAAAPVVFGICRDLFRGRAEVWYQAPADVATRQVCTLSGEPAGPDCPVTRLASYLPGRSSTAVCTVHRRILVDATSGHLLCAHCAAGRTAQWRVAAVYPPAVAQWLDEHGGGQGHGPESVPPHWPGCPAAGGRERLAILRPADGQRFTFMPDRPGGDQRVELRAAAPGDVTGLFWFVDGRLIGRSAPTAPAHWAISPGRHELRCADDRGRSAAVRVIVD